jgi:hypothetical protein
MSIGNLKTNGNKGNNFPYQLAVLELLRQIASGTGGSGVARASSMIRSSSAGSISAGAKSVSFYNSGTVNATVLGSALKPGEQVTFSVENPDTLQTIPYSGVGTDLLITTIV